VDVWNLHEFRAGLGFGIVASGALLLAALLATVRDRGRPLPLGGVVIAAGALWAFADTRPVPNAVVIGVVGIGAAAALASFRWVSPWHSVALAVPFAWAIGFHGDVVDVAWARILVTVAASGGAILVSAFDYAWREEAPGLTLLAVTAVGMYATVPDTEQVAAALGVVLPLVVLGWPVRLATLGRPGAAAAVAMLMWAGGVGAQGRPASIVGFVVCLGLLAAAPVGEVLLPRAGARLEGRGRRSLILLMVTSHVLLVIAASRVVGKVSDPLLAAVIGAVVAFAAVLVGAHVRPAASRSAKVEP
jgi:hypothetical protein